MSATSKIEWTDSTFNPWIGCTKVSPGCDHCYAERDWDKRRHRVQWGAGNPRSRTSVANRKLPERWNAQRFVECSCGYRGTIDQITTNAIHYADCIIKPARRRVFCASLADWLDNEVPIEWLVDLLDVIRLTPNLDWLPLTKRVGNWKSRLADAAGRLHENDRQDASNYGEELRHWVEAWLGGTPPPNVWLGATIVNQEEADRDIPKLLAVPARVRFLSMEPLLGQTILRPDWITRWPNRQADVHSSRPPLDWVIAGGESGPNARPSHPDWFRSLRDQCQVAGVPFLFKQWGEIAPLAAIADHGFNGSADAAADAYLKNHHATGLAGADLIFRCGKKAAGRTLDGRTWDEFPKVAA
jgi:protein gp37